MQKHWLFLICFNGAKILRFRSHREKRNKKRHRLRCQQIGGDIYDRGREKAHTSQAQTPAG